MSWSMFARRVGAAVGTDDSGALLLAGAGTDEGIVFVAVAEGIPVDEFVSVVLATLLDA